MTQDYTLSKSMLIALFQLHKLIKEEGVPDPGVGQAPVGLSADARKVLYLLGLYDQERAAVRAKRREAALRPVEMDETAAPTSTPVPIIQDALPLSGQNDQFTDLPFQTDVPPSPSQVPKPAETVPPHALEPDCGAAGDQPREVSTGPVVSVPSVSVAPALKACDPPEASSALSLPSIKLVAPQPGGVPAMPGLSPVSEKPTVMPIGTVKKITYLKNARANEAYTGAVDIEGLKGLKLEDSGGSGLIFDEASGLLKGTPSTSGDFVIRLQGLVHGKRCEIVANLAVIPDPKSLWISKDSDRSDPFWKPDEAFERAEGDLLCVAASKRGRSHAKDGTFRDDDFGLLTDGPGGWHIAAVADGAGSAKFSRRGSKVAVDSILGELPKMLEDHVTPLLPKFVPAYLQGNSDAGVQIKSQLYQSLATAAFNAAKAIEGEAAVKGEKASAFSTTIIVTVARKIPEGWFIAGFSVGDGGAAVFDLRDGSLTTLTLPDSGEFAGQTRFLQKTEFTGGFDEVAKRIFFDIRKDFTAIALMTDGISDPKFPTDSVFGDPGAWAEFWNGDLTKAVDFSRTNVAMETQFLEWLDFWSPGNHDDRTLAVLVP